MKKSERYQERKRQKKAHRDAQARIKSPTNVVRIGPPAHPWPDLLGLGGAGAMSLFAYYSLATRQNA